MELAPTIPIGDRRRQGGARASELPPAWLTPEDVAGYLDLPAASVEADDNLDALDRGWQSRGREAPLRRYFDRPSRRSTPAGRRPRSARSRRPASSTRPATRRAVSPATATRRCSSTRSARAAPRSCAMLRWREPVAQMSAPATHRRRPGRSSDCSSSLDDAGIDATRDAGRLLPAAGRRPRRPADPRRADAWPAARSRSPSSSSPATRSTRARRRPRARARRRGRARPPHRQLPAELLALERQRRAPAGVRALRHRHRP